MKRSNELYHAIASLIMLAGMFVIATGDTVTQIAAGSFLAGLLVGAMLIADAALYARRKK